MQLLFNRECRGPLPNSYQTRVDLEEKLEKRRSLLERREADKIEISFRKKTRSGSKICLQKIHFGNQNLKIYVLWVTDVLQQSRETDTVEI